VWPVNAIIWTTNEVLRRHKVILNLYGIPAWRLWVESLYYALFFNIKASAYYKFELWEPHRKKQIFHLLQDFEVWLILNHFNHSRDTNKLDDKHRFNQFAGELGLPVPELVATFRHGKLSADSKRFPRRDLFVKNNNASGGLATARWVFNPDSDTWANFGSKFNEQELTEALLRRSLETNLVLQVCERLHPDLLPLSNGAIATFRAMTIKHGTNSAHILHANMRMPVGDSVVDNVHSGGLSAKVGNDGILSGARLIDVGHAPFHHHPDTGARITGSRLPFYDQMAELALNAHNAMPEFCTVAWDISVVERGPVIIEANSWFGLEVFQHTRREALGDSAFLEFVKKEWKVRT